MDRTSIVALDQFPSRAEKVIVAVDEGQCARMRAMQSFRFSHGLGHFPLLSLDSVKQIARDLLDQRRFNQVFYTTGKLGAGNVYSDEQRRREVLDTLDMLGSENAWLRLTRVDEVFPDLRRIVDQFYGDLSDLYGFEVKPRVYKTLMTLFVSSPGAITPYHMDHTWNFLLQISGRKTVYLFDPNDPLVVSQRARELYYTEQGNVAKNSTSGDGIAFDLEPGFGVHHPVNAPHWVQNGPQVSISLSLGLCLHESNRNARIHQVNYMLRRIGLDPSPPGKAGLRDSMKAKFMGLFSDRRPNGFDDILFSGWRRLMHLRHGRLRAK